MNQSRPTVSVIIPTYNEADNIPILLNDLTTSLKDLSFEIIVVDDDSPDLTWKKAEEISSNNGAIRVIRRLKERGLSSAVVRGMETALGDVFVVMDADLQHDDSIIPHMVKTISDDGYDIVIGSRAAEGGSYGEWSRKRRFISWVAATMARIVLPPSVKDPMSGFFAISRKLFQSSAERLNPMGFKILLEFIGRNKNLKIKEIGYQFRNRIHGETKLSGSVIKNYIVALYDLKFGKYLSATFAMYAFVGSTGVVVNLFGFGLGELIGFPKIYTGISQHIDPIFLSVPFGIQLSIFSNYILNNYITFFEKRHRGSSMVRGIIYFELISMFGLLIQMSAFQLLHVNGFMAGILAERFRAFFNNALGILTATVSNYYLNVNVTWRNY